MEDPEAEDLQAFELRLADLVKEDKPHSFRWRLVFGAIFACSAISACHWMRSDKESEGEWLVLRILSSHGVFAFSLATICLLVIYGINHVTKQSPRILRDTREMLSPFRLDCDNQGRLILLPEHIE
ncbi:nuclear envelope phosphatase-regulatory subunit 1 homolog [Drosophila ficusphila]|uniref:nuclear envelope phosphatase-regulatory subunit 1 homolog n=1 Tax=Drosophila ficusphila TaxID=30025 RepID=UPI0007E5F5BC|nr:nuclear envelope phosphatase-regulatory subunit 1 homolog [Drosophila ficusphila]